MGVALASLSPISSWVGLQIGYTKAVLGDLGVSPPLDGFLVVLRSLPFRFFPLFYLLFIVMVLVSGRDFGPMASAESGSGASSAVASGGPAPPSPAADSQLEADPAGGAGAGGGITPKAGTPLRSRNALVPFAAVIVVTFAGMILDGISKIEAAGNEVYRGSPCLRVLPCPAFLRLRGNLFLYCTSVSVFLSRSLFRSSLASLSSEDIRLARSRRVQYSNSVDHPFPFVAALLLRFTLLVLCDVMHMICTRVFSKVPTTLVNILSSCDSVSVLIWASAAGWITSLVLVCGQGILTLPEAMETWMEGMKVT